MKALNHTQKGEAAVLTAGLLLYGLFYEGFAGIAGIILLALLGLKVHKTKTLYLPKSLLLLSLLIMPAAALLTSLWAIDSGMAVLGFVKYLPVAAWILLMAAEDEETKGTREQLLHILPYVIAAATAFGLLTYFTPMRDYFFINGRFSGVFQYANSYALLLLIGLILLLWGSFGKLQTMAMTVVFVGGIIATGCRAVFFLTVLSVVMWVLSGLRQKATLKKGPLLAVLAIICGSVILGLVTGDMYGFARFTRFEITSSSLSGRLLYNLDGLKMLMNHPLGLGHRGYSFYQGAVQTGNYSVTFAHNDLLQVALDFGVIMGLLVGIGYVMMIFRKDMPVQNRLILIVCAIHGLFDWSLQFPVLLMILVLVSGWDSSLEISIREAKRILAASAAAVSVVLAGWLGTASLAEFAGAYEAAAGIYPGMTTSQMRVISSAQSDFAKYDAAEKIAKRNDYCTIALQAMAEKGAREGNFPAMADYGLKAARSSKYNTSGYEIYLYFLSYAAETCNAAGDAEGTLYYLTRAAEIDEIIKAVEAETSPLAANLYDKPEIRLADEYENYISQAKTLTEGR